MRYVVRERPPSGRSRRYGQQQQQQQQRHVGEVLVSEGSLSEEQLREALEKMEEKTDGRRLGEILLSRELVSGEELARAVAGATGSEYVSLSEDLIDPAAIPLLGTKELSTHRLIEKIILSTLCNQPSG